MSEASNSSFHWWAYYKILTWSHFYKAYTPTTRHGPFSKHRYHHELQPLRHKSDLTHPSLSNKSGAYTTTNSTSSLRTKGWWWFKVLLSWRSRFCLPKHHYGECFNIPPLSIIPPFSILDHRTIQLKTDKQ